MVDVRQSAHYVNPSPEFWTEAVMKCVEQVIVKCSENIKYFNVLGELPTPPIQVPFPLQQTPDWVAGVNIVHMKHKSLIFGFFKQNLTEYPPRLSWAGWREQRDIGIKTAAVVAAAEQSHCGIVSLLPIFQLLKTSRDIRNKNRSLSHISLHTFTVHYS